MGPGEELSGWELWVQRFNDWVWVAHGPGWRFRWWLVASVGLATLVPLLMGAA